MRWIYVNNKENLISIFAQDKMQDIMWLKRLSFTNILICSNMMQTMFSKTQNGITSKQWLLLTIASNLNESPTLSEIGVAMGCSRQNVKQIAEVLNRKGYLSFTKMDGDKNALRIVPTQKWFAYNRENEEMTSNILEEIFEGFSDNEITAYFKSFSKIIHNIEKINEEIKDK